MFPSQVNSEIRSAVAQAQREAYDLYVKKRNVQLETALHVAWVNFTEYHSMQEGLDVLAREAESHGNLEAAEALWCALRGPAENKESTGPLTKRVRRILKRIAFTAVLLLVALIPAARAQSRETIKYWVEINDREQVTIHLLDREFTDAEYLTLIARKLKTVGVSRKPGAPNAIVLFAPRATNPALAQPTTEELTKFWGERVSLVMGKLRARISPAAMLEQSDGPAVR
jgi:hypothetical protein